jgi:hypothetical protein
MLRCCGRHSVSNVNWDTQDDHDRGRLDGQWIVVPDDRVVAQPNRIGPSIVRPQYPNGNPIVRCFMPGTMT